MGIENLNNNAMLYLFQGTDFYDLQQKWNSFADQQSIKIVDQSMQVDPNTLTIILACWYIWDR